MLSRRVIASTIVGLSATSSFYAPRKPLFRPLHSSLCDKVQPSRAYAQSSDILTKELHYKADNYSGVIVDYKTLPNSSDEFSARLTSSLAAWRKEGKRGVWLSLPVDKIAFAESAVKAGFVPHHAEKDYIMLTHWLSDDENHLPASASHQVGVGVIVVREDGKILVVMERNGPLKGTGFFKIPTGLVDQGEEIWDAAVREVNEETGIETEFAGIVAFRHSHKMLFGKSDLFFICVSKPKTVDIKVQESELEDAKWIDLESYLAQELMKKSPLYQQIQEVIKIVVEHTKSGKDVEKMPDLLKHGQFELGWRPGKQTIYRALK